jgi:hypothetical protein
MKKNLDKCTYTTEDASLKLSNREVIYPINAFLEKNLEKDDDVKLLLLIKKDDAGNYQSNSAEFVKELLAINKDIGARIEHRFIETDFSEEQSVHEQLMGKIVDEIDDGSHIIADITYGPKDVPIVLFSALSFAEKFLSCEIDNIIYGQATFVDNKPTNTKICDMVPLYYLNSVIGAVRCEDPLKARKILKSLLSI